MKSATAAVLASIFMVLCICVSIFCFTQDSVLPAVITLGAALLNIPIIFKAKERVSRRCLYLSVACFLIGATLAPNFTREQTDVPGAYGKGDVAAMAEMGMFGHDSDSQGSDESITIDNQSPTVLMPGGTHSTQKYAAALQNDQIRVHFIDVGQGDCSLITGNDFAMLIDSGISDNAERILAYLNEIGVSQLDCVVCTHPHSDHIGAMADIIGAYSPGTIILPDIAYDSTAYSKLDAAIAFANVNVIYPTPDSSYRLGENGAYFTILGPIDLGDTSDPDFEINNVSVVLKVNHGHNSFLFTGDIEEVAERDLISSGQDITATVLKVPHHGSVTSSSEDFISAVKPKYAVIQCGAENEYGHPHDAVIRRLSRHNADIFRTDLDGTIVATSDGESIDWFTVKDSMEHDRNGAASPSL